MKPLKQQLQENAFLTAYLSLYADQAIDEITTEVIRWLKQKLEDGKCTKNRYISELLEELINQ